MNIDNPIVKRDGKAPESLSILGAGRVGRALGRRLRELGWKIDVVVTRSEASARRAVRFIGAGRPYAGLTRQVFVSSVILVAVPDDQIARVAAELARMGGEELQGKIVLHTSGALDAGVLGIVKAHGAAVGSLHPLQSFSGVAVPSLEGKVFAVEGDIGAVRVGRRIARLLGGSPVRIAPGKKALYHAAAAMAAGHVLAIEEASTQLLVSLGMGRREAIRALLPLTRQVLDNFERFGPHPAWTGPLSRRDYKIVAAHMRALQNFPGELASAYHTLNRLAARMLSQDATGMLAELERIAAEEKPNMKAKRNSA